MNVPVEAQSLSALNNLFANPPQYPRNPTHEVRDSLALYIVRVPGSKDVFLTPLKPPTKASISLEAIQSSLYYLHVATEEDEEVKKSMEEQSRSAELERIKPPIHRKPLPLTPHTNYPPYERPAPPPKNYPFYQPGLENNPNASQEERYAARGAHLKFISERQKNDANVHRKSPSPPRFQRHAWSENSNGDFVVSSDSFLLGSRDMHSLRHSLADHEPKIPRLPHSPDSGRHADKIAHSGRAPGLTSSSDAYHHSSAGRNAGWLTITLIRRDPVSGCQWNVGNIRLDESRDSNMPLNPIEIEITTPGYSRFASAPEFHHPMRVLSDANSIKEALANGTLISNEGPEEYTASQVFSRVANYQQQTIESNSFKLHRRTSSSDSFIKPPSPTKPIRHVFSFMSPWQGVCSFSNGIDGRSLKCRHALSSSTFTEEDTTSNVAELRFNLPWFVLTSNNDKEPEDDALPIAKLLNSRSGKDTIKRSMHHFRNLSRDLHHRRPLVDDSSVLQELPKQPQVESELDRLSLKLGREKAGGGFKGTSAKLGKLIIDNEGLKMCDLVVAACMGVWWQHYERKGD